MYKVLIAFSILTVAAPTQATSVPGATAKLGTTTSTPASTTTPTITFAAAASTEPPASVAKTPAATPAAKQTGRGKLCGFTISYSATTQLHSFPY